MSNIDQSRFVVIGLGGSMSSLVQSIITQNKRISSCLCVIPTRCGQTEISNALDEAQKHTNIIIAIGFTGGVDSSINIGDIVIPIKAYGIETKEEEILDKKLVRDLISFPWSFPLRIHHGTVWTSQHIIHKDSIEKDFLEKANCLSVDMEVYWLCSQAIKRSIRVAAILVVSDHIFRQPLELLSNGSNTLPQSAETIALVREILEASVAIYKNTIINRQ